MTEKYIIVTLIKSEGWLRSKGLRGTRAILGLGFMS